MQHSLIRKVIVNSINNAVVSEIVTSSGAITFVVVINFAFFILSSILLLKKHIQMLIFMY